MILMNGYDGLFGEARLNDITLILILKKAHESGYISTY